MAFKALHQGDTGEVVAALQRQLAVLRLYSGRIDADFGPKTDTAVRTFQAANGLAATGVVTEQTARMLDRAAPPSPPPVPGGAISLTAPQWRRMFSGASEALIVAMFERQDQVLGEHEINNNKNRLTFFLAQTAHESGGGAIMIENHRYSAKNLGDMWDSNNWRSYFPDRAAMVAMAGRGFELFDIVYGNRMGNGGPATHDGSRFRGRGLIQLTGRTEYRDVGALAGLPLEADPDLATLPENALACAAACWSLRKLNPLADINDFEEVTRRINGGTIGITDRRQRLALARQILG